MTQIAEVPEVTTPTYNAELQRFLSVITYLGIFVLHVINKCFSRTVVERPGGVDFASAKNKVAIAI